jgi:hypothetical protein
MREKLQRKSNEREAAEKLNLGRESERIKWGAEAAEKLNLGQKVKKIK